MVTRGLRSRARFKRMPVLIRDREEDVPECSGLEISWIFREKSGSQEMAFGNADL